MAIAGERGGWRRRDGETGSVQTSEASEDIGDSGRGFVGVLELGRVDVTLGRWRHLSNYTGIRLRVSGNAVDMEEDQSFREERPFLLVCFRNETLLERRKVKEGGKEKKVQ